MKKSFKQTLYDYFEYFALLFKESDESFMVWYLFSTLFIKSIKFNAHAIDLFMYIF